ncbi:hypothetical protein EVA_16023 [gut metagenome]|uniref:Uncharacterized protein n=1 Tax=gut metagenome TaxID=749906 RepID=J9G230_9ZZZZ
MSFPDRSQLSFLQSSTVDAKPSFSLIKSVSAVLLSVQINQMG